MIDYKTIATTDTVLFTVPPGKEYTIVTMYITNFDIAEETLYYLKFIKSSDLVGGNDSIVIPEAIIDATDTLPFNADRFILNEGDRIIGKSKNGKLNLFVSFAEM